MSEEATLDEFVEDVSSESTEVDAISDGDLQQLEESPIESWKLVKLGDILSLEYGDNLPADSRDSGDIPVYGSNGQVDTHSEPAVDKSGIILGRKGSIGEIEFSNEPFWPIDTTYYITDEKTEQNLQFLYYLLQNIQLERLNAASAIPGLNRNDTYGLNAIISPLEEQRKIATVLHNVDQAIQKLKEIIEQINRVRRGFVKERVVAARSDGKHKEGTIGTRRVTIPENWSTVRLGDVAEIVSGKSFPRDHQKGHAGPRAVIKVEDMNLPGNDKYIDNVTNRVTDEVLDELNKNVFTEDTVIHPRVGEALLLNKTRLTTEKSAFDDNIMGWIPKEINSEYLYYASTLVDFNAVAQAGTVPSINKEMAANFRFPYPPSEEQEEIASDLSQIDCQVSIYEVEKQRLQRFKKALMQDLLSGKVRTTDTSIAIPDEIQRYG